jgi:hypothetical protein
MYKHNNNRFNETHKVTESPFDYIALKCGPDGDPVEPW